MPMDMGETRLSPCRAILWSLVALALVHECLSACYRIPQGATGERSPVDDNYQILIEGNPATYLPGRTYNLSLSCAKGLSFMSFTLVAEAENPSLSLANNDLLGQFEITNPADTKFSNLCENMIESSNNNIKHRIGVTWVAPDHPQSGCILFKAAVLQHRNVWFVDDGRLTKSLCREHVDEIHSQSPPVDPCCACDEAKYEIIVERTWTRNTHPTDFPAEAWRTKFGTLIGTSHKVNQSFWNYGTKASPGMEELAEHGATTKLEMEIKNNVNARNTIIKAPPVEFKENVVTRTFATVRVTPQHHMISLVSKIVPSPDWILGVSSLELCSQDCKWIEKKVLSLYPWDLGTDGGISYMSADKAQKPPDVIRRITSTFPSDVKSPFYDKNGTPMKPLGTLIVTRKRTYGSCVTERPVAQVTNYIPECQTHQYSGWSNCSMECGPGTQTQKRSYVYPELAKSKKCNVTLSETRPCTGECTFLEESAGEFGGANAECELTQWSLFSECSSKCGRGTKTRTRGYVNPAAENSCQSGAVRMQLVETVDCEGIYCGGGIPQDGNGLGFDYDRQPYGTNYMESSDLQSQNTNPLLNTYGNIQNTYGSEQLIGGNPANSFEDPPLAGNLDNNRNRPTNQNLFGPSTWDSNPYTTPYEGVTTPRSSFGDSLAEEQKFCLQLPVASMKPCEAQRVFIKNYWFYHAFDMECKLFTADNCDQNRNKFMKLEDCERECGGVTIEENQNNRVYGSSTYNNRNSGSDYGSSTYNSRNPGNDYGSSKYNSRNPGGGYGSPAYGKQNIGDAYGSPTYGNQNIGDIYSSSTYGNQNSGDIYGSSTYGNQNSGDVYGSSTGEIYGSSSYGNQNSGNVYGSSTGDIYGSSSYGNQNIGDIYSSSTYGNQNSGNVYGSSPMSYLRMPRD